MTANQIPEYVEGVIAEQRLSGDSAGLKELQTAAGFLTKAADYAGARDSAVRFQVLAAEATNKRAEADGEE